MEIRLDRPDTSNLICLGISLLGAAYAYFTGRKVRSVCKTLDKSVEDLAAKDVSIDISKEIVDLAVKEKVDKEVKAMVPLACRQAISEAKTVFKDEVQREINAQYSDIKAEVTREVREKADNIDINDVKKQVIAKATDAAEEKFRGDLNNLLASYNDKIAGILSVYQSIEKKLNA